MELRLLFHLLEKIVDHGKEICFPSGMQEMGPISRKLYETLTGIQYWKNKSSGWLDKNNCINNIKGLDLI